MRVKRQKINRRTIRFYKTCCGFREPFKVLCDGTLLHYILSNKLGSPNDLFSGLLAGPARTFMTRCIVAEIKKLGESFAGTMLAARRLDSAKCNHEPLKPASDCLEGLVEGGNPEHFFVATQDAELRGKLRQIPGVAIILAQNNFLVLEPPSAQQQSFARLSEAERNHAKGREFKIIEERENRKEAELARMADILGKELEEYGESRDKVERITKQVVQKRSLGDRNMRHNQQKNRQVKDRPQFKRKMAKGPNPLSCKKKKMKLPGIEKTIKQSAASNDEGQSHSRKKRHRIRKKKSKERGQGV